MSDKLIKPSEACKRLGICIKTLQNWDRDGKIEIIRTPSNRRLVPEREILRLKGVSLNKDVTVLYARVSSYDQKKKGDLDRQVARLVKVCSDYGTLKVVTDVASGLNDNRKGLLQAMELASKREITRIIVTYKDRLTRFGFNYLSTYFKAFDVEIVILYDIENKSPQEEMIDDLMSIVSSFAGKLYGLRSQKHKKITKKTKELLDETKLSDQNKK